VELTVGQRLALEDAHQALVYLEAARRVLGHQYERFNGDLEMMAPAGFLIAHAVEIGLSAYLRFTGKKGGLSNHDLQGRLDAAERAGLSVTEPLRKYVRAIHAAHQSGQLRYARDDQHPFVSPVRPCASSNRT